MKMNQTVDSHSEISIFPVHKEYFFWVFFQQPGASLLSGSLLPFLGKEGAGNAGREDNAGRRDAHNSVRLLRCCGSITPISEQWQCRSLQIPGKPQLHWIPVPNWLQTAFQGEYWRVFGTLALQALHRPSCKPSRYPTAPAWARSPPGDGRFKIWFKGIFPLSPCSVIPPAFPPGCQHSIPTPEQSPEKSKCCAAGVAFPLRNPWTK